MALGQKIRPERKFKKADITSHFTTKYVFHLEWASIDTWCNSLI